jgi:hypothetical protein
MSCRRVLIVTTALVVLTRVGLFPTESRAQAVPEASYSAGVLGTAESGAPLDTERDKYILIPGSVSDGNLTIPGAAGGTASNTASRLRRGGLLR